MQKAVLQEQAVDFGHPAHRHCQNVLDRGGIIGERSRHIGAATQFTAQSVHDAKCVSCVADVLRNFTSSLPACQIKACLENREDDYGQPPTAADDQRPDER